MKTPITTTEAALKVTFVSVLSSDCTHVLPDEGLVLEGGVVTQIPESHLKRALQFPGVTLINSKTTE